MPDQIAQLEQRIAALESNRVPFNLDAQNKSSLATVLSSIYRPKIYTGLITASGNMSYGPSGWTVSKISTGQYKVVHNLKLTGVSHTIFACVTGSNTRAVATVTGADDFFVYVGNASNSAGEDNNVFFQVII